MRGATHSWLRAVPLALLSGLLLALAFPRFDLHLLAWVALVPLLIALRGGSLKSAFALSALTGVVFFRVLFYWINNAVGVTWGEQALLSMYLGAYIGLFGLLQAFVDSRTGLPAVVTAPPIWIAVEYLRANAGFLSLPWGLLGHSQHANLPIIQIAAFTGAYGVSLLIAMVNALLADLLTRRSLRPPTHLAPAAVTVAVLLATLVYGFTALSEATSREQLRVSVIQGNIPQAERWERQFLTRNLERHLRLSREAGRDRPTLIVWPETSVPGALTEDLKLATTLAALARETGAYLLVGSAVRPKFGPRDIRRERRTNSAFLFSPEGVVVGRYNKMWLLPFAEHLPYEGVLPWPPHLTANAGRFVPGREYAVLNLKAARLGVTICWENIFPGIARRFVASGANVIVNLTNEAWFGQSSAPHQFLAMAVFRAVENRVAVVRSANTGVSSVIDPYGRVVGKVTVGGKDIFVEGVLTASVPVSRDHTVYTRYGDLVAQAGLGVALVLVGVATAGAIRTQHAPRAREAPVHRERVPEEFSPNQVEGIEPSPRDTEVDVGPHHGPPAC